MREEFIFKPAITVVGILMELTLNPLQQVKPEPITSALTDMELI
jgi:hypothetical protein